ncbi:glycosyltransferase family 2 protein [Flavobacterium sp.]|uniref:glycosyltransferase family 2 protein n=1 Tax=Flavobacterium sp. TaxID=239 RepID=UPI00260FFC40|nr:glycosyltransferase family 2 protein [Flavobacterium sp.]
MKTHENEIAVSICMSAYNHEEFIEEALVSVLEQNCQFDFEVILSNDCSKDKTDEVINKIIKNHPKGHTINYTNQEKNLGMNGNLIFTLEQVKGKYIALLEGDDYWTDKNKLQKQFDFLESNLDYALCTAGHQSIIPNVGLVTRTVDGGIDGITYDFKKIDNFRPHYLNMFFRANSLDIERLKTFEYSGDNVIFIMCLSKGKGYFFNQVFGFRRTHPNGAWTGKSEIERIKMGSEQFIGLYRFPEYRKAIRSKLFHTYLDIVSSGDTNKNYIVQAFKLIRSFKEFLYFIKIVSRYFFTKKI